jgi:hypothetical protein
MAPKLSRRALLALLKVAPKAATTSERVKEAMPVDGVAEFLGTMSGGDDEWACAVWRIPGIGVRELYMRRTRLERWLHKGELGRIGGVDYGS